MKYKLKNKIDSDYLYSLLRSRGINNIEEFFSPSPASLNDPELLDNIEETAQFLLKVIEDPESNIWFVVDCDVDGFTSSAILWQYINRISDCKDRLHYIVHEKKQHGLEDLVERLLDLDPAPSLVIVPDAGSNDYTQHKVLYDNGIPVIVLDHHEAHQYSEHALVVNNQLSDRYPNKNLSGAGVVYKFCQYIDKILNVNYAKDYIDLAAFGIVSDMMDLKDLENRYIVSYGLKHITNMFLIDMISKQSFSMKGKVNPTTIAFYVTPLVNALIRVGSYDEKMNLFLAFIDPGFSVDSTKRGEKGKTETISVQSVRNCVNAKSRQERAKTKMIEQLEITIFNNNLADNKIIVVPVTDEDIDSSLTGLIAMQLVSKYKKPVLVVKENEDGFLRGSARNNGQSDLRDLKQFIQDSHTAEYAEGHANAHGVSIPAGNLDKFISYANENLADVDFNEDAYDVDFCFDLKDPNLRVAIKDIGQYPDIWSQGNPEPFIAITNINISKGDIFVMGENRDSVKFVKNGVTFVRFKDADFIAKLESMDDVGLEIVGHANANEWNGSVTYQLIIEDYNMRDRRMDF